MDRLPQQGPLKPLAEVLRRRFQWLSSFDDDELRKISLCELEEGEPEGDDLYFDLSHPEAGSFKGAPGRTVPEGSCYISKTQVGDHLWNKLTSFYRA